MLTPDNKCIFQDGSYPCGDRKNPDCSFCKAIHDATISKLSSLSDEQEKEEIAFKLPMLWCDECPYYEEPGQPHCPKPNEKKPCQRQLEYAAQILAITNASKVKAVEDARRELIDRIQSNIDNLENDEYGYPIDEIELIKEWWQALKGGKE